ncbi:MAG: hypothetical protein BGP00_23375 [Novosphingobium sp. 63-713]|nr:MAG: hypothetical protein BGP00_23375 [Novosphingobium sp. 63-713]
MIGAGGAALLPAIREVIDMEDNSLKREALKLWSTAVSWFSFISLPEGRGAAVVAAAVLVLLISPLLFVLVSIGAAALIAYRASKTPD